MPPVLRSGFQTAVTVLLFCLVVSAGHGGASVAKRAAWAPRPAGRARPDRHFGVAAAQSDAELRRSHSSAALSIAGQILRGDRATLAFGRPVVVEFRDLNGEVLGTDLTTNGIYEATLIPDPGQDSLIGRVSVVGEDMRFEESDLPFVIGPDDSRGPEFVAFYEFYVAVEGEEPACECNDWDPCTFDACVEATCVSVPRVYGDMDHNGIVNLFDVFCVIEGIGGDFSTCSFAQADIHGACGDSGGSACCPDGIVNLFDAFSVLDATRGVDPCCQ